ncbi:MAG: WYL domain-containing protein [Clostridia bacterium]|nr:WYL domain-containing protein [Clostridia bacterium]
MAGNKNQKLKLLYLLDILAHKSDEENPLSALEICELLNEVGITAERKSIYKDISVIRDFGYDIIATKTPKAGFFMSQREFELPEVRLLMDAVQSASFITPKKTHELIQKLNTLVSEKQALVLQNQIYVDSRIKHGNEEIYYNIDNINTAISKGCKITFKYIRRQIDLKTKARSETKVFTVSPYALLWSNDHYYLISNNEKYDDLMHLRVDRMKGVTLLEDVPVRHFSEVSDYKKSFDTADYANKTFNMFGGEVKTVEIRCANSMLEEVFDRFGPEVPIRMSGADHFVFRINAMLSEGLVSWIISFGLVEVIAPIELRRMVTERVKRLTEVYKV